MDATPEFVDLVTRAHEYLGERQDVLRRDFALESWPRWDWDQDSGTIVFSGPGPGRVEADIQFVGSISTESGTWLWAWDNPYVDAALRRDVREVRRFGEAHGIAQLVTARWEADEVDGWEMTSIAALVLQAEGAYRTPTGKGFTYLLLRNVRRVR